MKTLIITSAIAISGLFYSTAHAQIGVRVGFNFGARPVYAPAQPVQDEPVYQDQDQAGYDDDYYYLPDVDAYYCVAEQCYYYNDGGNWISAAYLPGYSGFDWRNSRHFEIRGHRPFMNNDYYRSRFGGAQNRFQGGYANAGRFNQGYNRGPEQHFENRGWGGERNYNNQGYRQNNGGQFANRGGEQFNQNRGFDRSQQFNQNRGGDRGQQFNQNRGGDRGQQFNQNRGGDRGQQFNQNRGGDRGQQFNQNRGGDRGNNGGEHFAQNNNRGGQFNGGGDGRRR